MNDLGTLSVSAERRVDEVCVRFESDLQAGQPVKIEEYLGAVVEPERSARLRELLRLEVEYRTRRGEQPTLEEYRTRFPTYCTFIASWFPSELTIESPSPAEARPSWPNLPGYEFVAELGCGGMGVVYQARHIRFQRAVAIKMIRAGAHAVAEQTTRFLSEARAVARLQHPNIVQIHEIAEHNGSPYFSLEYVDGGNLATRLKVSPPSDMEASRLVELLARTVHYAHGRGIVHRDLKPANILLTSDGIPKIADFGLAKFLDEDLGLSMDGAVLGTASYMAPEQAAGKIRDIGRTTDVYALGAILYEMITGQPPFRGSDYHSTLRAVVEEFPESPHLLNPRVDPTLEAICWKCLEKHQADRYQSAEALADDLAAFQRGEAPNHVSTGAARQWIKVVLRESRYTEVMTLWSHVWMGIAVIYFLACFAKSMLIWNEVRDHVPYHFVWGLSMLAAGGIVWYCRIRHGLRFSFVERQLGQIWLMFWIGVFVAALLYQRSGGPIEFLLPIVITQLAVAFISMAAILGGSFYVMSAACLATAILETFWPSIGPLISAAICSPALFWLGWKYARSNSMR